MLRPCLAPVVALLFFCPVVASADDPVFSGPQVGEKLPSLKAQGIFGDLAGKEFDVVADADGQSLLIVFFHERTRPAFGLAKTVASYAAEKSDKGIKPYVIFLTDDPTSTEKWAKAITQHFAKGVIYGLSMDGKEGPGAYGLNRNVALTILVGNEGKVTSNSALIQPQLQADGPKILQAIADVTGGGDVPPIETLADNYRNRMKGKNPRMRAAEGRGTQDPKLSSLLRAVINKQASEEDVKKAAAKVESYVAENEKAKKELTRIVTTIVKTGKLSNYGTEAAQKVLRSWMEKYAGQKPASVE